jgi:hypothetical protein
MDANEREFKSRLVSRLFAACWAPKDIRRAQSSRLATADSFSYTELAENPAEQIFGVVTPDHVAYGVKGATQLD